MSTNQIQYDFFKGRQSLELLRVREIDGHKIKVHIDRDSYDHQSSAIAYVWSNDGWKVVIDRPIDAMRAVNASYATQNPERYEDDFNLDADDLQAAALAVVS